MLNRPIALVVCLCLALFTLIACGSSIGGTPPAATPTVPPPTPTPSPVPFTITSIDMAVTPKSIAGMACGTSVNVVYTATFHAPAHSPGGTVQFLYTVNNGRSSPMASITFGPGETSKIYTFNWSGKLEPDNVYPGLGGVITTSPNEVRSPSVKPDGTCTAPMGVFQVSGIDLAVSPSSIAGTHCGDSISLAYTVTFHLAPNGPGGIIKFSYTTNNGRSQTDASVAVGPGEIMKIYTFTLSGTLPADHTFPGIAIVMSTSPNMVTSMGVKPAGQCS